MKPNQLDQIRQDSINKLKKQLEKERKRLVDLKMKMAKKELKNTQAVKMQKKTIAQLLTIIREKEFNK